MKGMIKNYRGYFKFLLIILLFTVLSGCCGVTPTSYTVTATAGAGGSINPSGAIVVSEGENQTFTITPEEGYEISDVLVDSVSVGAVSTYTLNNIQQDHTIAASFAQTGTPSVPVIIKYTITATAGTGGSIAPEGSVKVTKGNDRTFTITPDTCYQIADVLVDHVSIGAESTYAFINVQQDHTIEVSFVVSGTGVYNINKGQDYPSIQEAIDNADDNDTIFVCPGLYEENIEFVTGKNIIVRSADPLDPTIVATTIIDGQGIDHVVHFDYVDTSTLEGFTIRNGNAEYGGAIMMYASSPNIIRNIITGNSASSEGGGIFITYFSFPTITNNTITGNTVTGEGGGISVFGSSSPTITVNTIVGNGAMSGGGISICYDSEPTINENTIIGNTALSGGGIFIDDCNPAISNNSITSNIAHYNGGAIYVYNSGSPTVTGNTIKDNTADNQGGGIFVKSDSNLLPDTVGRPDDWGTGRENIPTGDPLIPAEGVEYEIAGNKFLGNEHGTPLAYTEGAHVYFE